ncbi:MAG: hypothetical protein J0H98_02990 [Solirubrobacterales bacterium]|nr:hypothetical protein [Solirubrobacterales bacterium]
MRGRQARLTIAIAIVLGGLFAGAASASAAATQRLDLDVTKAWIFQQVGSAYNGVPATGPDNDTLMMSSDLDSGAFSIPKEQFILNPQFLVGGPSGTFFFGATDNLTGTYDSATGEMAMSVPTKYVIDYPNPDPAPDAPVHIACEISGFTAELKTEGSISVNGTSTFSGRPFGPDQEGRLLGGWSVPLSALSGHIHGIDDTPDEMCQGMIGDLPGGQFAGQIWMQGKATVTDLPCPADQIGKPPNCRNAAPTFTLRPAKRSVKAGKTTSFKLRVQNGAGVAQQAKLAFKSSNRGVKVQKKLTVKVPARGVVITEVKVKVARNAKGRARITATSAGKRSGVTVIVKKAKARRKAAR